MSSLPSHADSDRLAELVYDRLRELAVLFVRAFGTFTNGLPSSYTQAATCGIRIGLVSDAPVKCLR